MTNQSEWYQEWFDTRFYHILYQHRDDTEAQLFIDNLLKQLEPPQESKILDLACGRGRHALYLHRQGYDVRGLDLSRSNIEYARQFEAEGLRFQQGDMRENFGEDEYDYIVNLFTSFGYFEHRSDNARALHMMKKALRPKGLLILDFMNINRLRLGLVRQEERLVDGIRFRIERFIRDERVIKSIRFEAEGRDHHYEEKVQLLDVNDFEELCEEAGLGIEKLYGDFKLNDFDPRNSDRLILFARPK